MDPGGCLRFWLMHRAGEDTTNVRWMSRSTLWGRLPPPNAFVNLNIETRLRMLRLIGALCDLRQGQEVPLMVSSFAEAALMGFTDRALKIIDLWVKGEQMPPWLEARCRQTQRHLDRRISTALLPAREGYQGLWLWISLHPSFHSPSLHIANCSEPEVGWSIQEVIAFVQEFGPGPSTQTVEVRYCDAVVQDLHHSHAQAHTVMHLNRLCSGSAWTSPSYWVAGQTCQSQKKQRKF